MGQLAYHDFEGVTVREEEGARLVEHLGDKRILMLRNHGPVVMGKTLPDAFIKYWALQRACEHQMATLQMGKPITVSPEVIAVHQRDLYMASPPGGAGRGARAGRCPRGWRPRWGACRRRWLRCTPLASGEQPAWCGARF
jgi:hypothetical protein